MTKEEIQYEAQCIIQECGSNDSAPYVEFVEKLASMKLPEPTSNLDGAAEFDKMFDDFCDQHPDGLTLNECAEFFYDKGVQAGAEWMAGQGVTHWMPRPKLEKE